MASQVKVGGLAIEVIRKDIKYAYLRLHPSTGRARISAPKRMSTNTIREFAASNLDWILKTNRYVGITDVRSGDRGRRRHGVALDGRVSRNAHQGRIDRVFDGERGTRRG